RAGRVRRPRGPRRLATRALVRDEATIGLVQDVPIETELMSTSKHHDGSAGDVDYAIFGVGYAQRRRPDPRIAAFVHRALGDAPTVLNVGAGAGSYEPTDREVTAVEPSASMRAQRPGHLVHAIDAAAENLPFADESFDASMATFTVHQWSNL